MGQFQSCILTCGAIVERCLKLEFENVNGPLPSGTHWTLGKCIGKCTGIVSKDVLDLAEWSSFYVLYKPKENHNPPLLQRRSQRQTPLTCVAAVPALR